MVCMCMTTALYLRFSCGMFELELLGSRRSLDDGSQWRVKWVMGYINEVHDRITFHRKKKKRATAIHVAHHPSA